MLHTLIFDFDGTLADCKRLHQQAFRNAVSAVTPLAEYQDESVEGLPTTEKIRWLQAQGYQFDATELNRLKQLETQLRLPEYIFVDPELIELINQLNKRFNLCLATNATAEFIERSLNIMGIQDQFDLICTASTYRPKPSTEMFEACMQHTGSERATTVIFEDSPMGIQCAYASGAQVIEVTGVEHTKQEMRRLL